MPMNPARGAPGGPSDEGAPVAGFGDVRSAGSRVEWIAGSSNSEAGRPTEAIDHPRHGFRFGFRCVWNFTCNKRRTNGGRGAPAGVSVVEWNAGMFQVTNERTLVRPL